MTDTWHGTAYPHTHKTHLSRHIHSISTKPSGFHCNPLCVPHSLKRKRFKLSTCSSVEVFLSERLVVTWLCLSHRSQSHLTVSFSLPFSHRHFCPFSLHRFRLSIFSLDLLAFLALIVIHVWSTLTYKRQWKQKESLKFKPNFQSRKESRVFTGCAVATGVFTDSGCFPDITWWMSN